MSTRYISPTPACATFAPLVPLLGTESLAPEQEDAVRAHVRDCAYCATLLAQYDALATGLRDVAASWPAPPSNATEIIMHTVTGPSSESTTPPPPPARRPRPRLASLAALAAVALIAVLAAVLFTSFAHPSAGPGDPPRYSLPGTKGFFSDISMLSDTDGWAIGQVTQTPDSAHPSNTVAFYHYDGTAWSPTFVTIPNTFALAGFVGSISCDSTTDCWAVGVSYNASSILFHYTGGTWGISAGPPLMQVHAFGPRAVWGIKGADLNVPSVVVRYNGTAWVPQTFPGFPSTARVVSLDMQSDTVGWALTMSAPQINSGIFTIYQYQNGAWTIHSTLTRGNDAYLYGLDMVSPTEGWLLGQETATDASGNTTHVPLRQLLFHYTNGAWQLTNLPGTNSGYVVVIKVAMRSATDGWLLGLEQNAYFGATVSNFTRHARWWHYTGGQWQGAAMPATGTSVDEITDFGFTPSGTGWASGFLADVPASKTVQDSDIPGYASPLLLTNTDGTWSIFQQG